jgi:hypothetical protein
MGVEVDRQVHLVLQRGDQHGGGGRFQQPRHVLQAQHMGARGLQLLGHGDVVLQVVLRPVGVEDVAGVADRALADLARLQHRIHRDAHVLDPVEAVEDAEDIDAGFGGGMDEFPHHVVGIVGVAHAVGPAQQHLRHDVGHGRAHVAQALPRAFLQEAIGHVEGRAAPAFHREKPGQVRGIGGRHLDHVERAHARGQKRLVPVAHGGVGDQQLFLLLHPVGHRLGPLFREQLAVPIAGVSARRAGGLGLDLGGAVRGGPAVSGCPFTVMSAI